VWRTPSHPASHPATQPRCRSYYAQRSGVEPKNRMLKIWFIYYGCEQDLSIKKTDEFLWNVAKASKDNVACTIQNSEWYCLPALWVFIFVWWVLCRRVRNFIVVRNTSECALVRNVMNDVHFGRTNSVGEMPGSCPFCSIHTRVQMPAGIYFNRSFLYIVLGLLKSTKSVIEVILLRSGTLDWFSYRVLWYQDKIMIVS